MTSYIIRRLALSFISIVALVVIVFFVTHVLGDPASIMLPPEATEEAIQALRHEMGLDVPLYIQFGRFAKELAHLDFGISLWQGKPVMELYFERLPRTALLATTSIIVAVFGGVLLGTLAALRPKSIADRIINVLTMFAVSSIDFWVGLMLILLVAVYLGWLPTSGYGGPSNLILPMLTVAFRPMGRIAQITRPAIIEECNKPYIMALRAKGLYEMKIFYHALRNAAIIVITIAGLEFAGCFAGAGTVIETVFAWPGVGLLLIQAIWHRDWPIIVAATCMAAIIVTIINLMVDLFYGTVNPQVRFE